MAGSGAGWLFLDASWETSLEMASCTGADAHDEYGSMTFFVFGLFTIKFVNFLVFLPRFKGQFDAVIRQYATHAISSTHFCSVLESSCRTSRITSMLAAERSPLLTPFRWASPLLVVTII